MVNPNEPIFVDSILKVTAKEDPDTQYDLNIPNHTNKTIEELLQYNEKEEKE